MKMKMRALLPVLVLVLGLAALLPARFAAPAGVVTAKADYPKYSVKVDDGYLALRNAKAFDYSNEIGKLYTGEIVQVMDTSDPTYWYVYAQSLGKYGYVNRNYLISVTVSGSEYTVKVDSGYLALRTAKAFDYNNEIGTAFENACPIHKASLGNGTIRLMKQRDLVDFAVRWIEENRK